jgi:hypothetical protein
MLLKKHILVLTDYLSQQYRKFTPNCKKAVSNTVLGLWGDCIEA